MEMVHIVAKMRQIVTEMASIVAKIGGIVTKMSQGVGQMASLVEAKVWHFDVRALSVTMVTISV
jgi:hypothetical protein